eukprot:8263069-Pyramimonas_sp.AAC.1
MAVVPAGGSGSEPSAARKRRGDAPDPGRATQVRGDARGSSAPANAEARLALKRAAPQEEAQMN